MQTQSATKLLIVEDDAQFSDVLATFGRGQGYEILWAPDGASALALNEAERPEVILLDIELPDIDGRDIMARMKSAGLAKDTVVIFVTALDKQSDRLVGLALGADDYETKPVHPSSLFRKIDHLRRKKHDCAAATSS